MANKPRGFGLSAECQRKTLGKFNVDDANAALKWVADVISHGGNDDGKGLAQAMKPVVTVTDVQENLKDGQILCHMINAIKPGSVKRINTSRMAFKQMENIGNFLSACDKIEVSKTDLFQTVDLYEANNIPAVITGLHAVGRKSKKVAGYDGPTIGPTESDENKREFTEEQLRAGDSVIGLQAGSNKGASQAGQNFGKTRAIID